ncbi:hypothetical protein FB382_003949 [Nocardioides ginsengisegetis]|uniref:Uncharacterized protein n=1 Tax=Nocardioides ginsengisegetis TaxID=661491 RepID=A0A7W3PBM9_9ACTN|nr:hypothetical protein [Nocardioides ginsengisegetis]MBA8805604.1 hypothetical protein [Nocardioides ginsengisegetis]
MTLSLKSSEQHRLVGAGVEGDLGLLLGRDDRDRAGAVALRDLDGRGADATGRAVHEHGLAGLHVAALGQRELRGQVVHGQRSPLVEADRVRQCERRDPPGC